MAKLSAAQRKNLPASQFAGPNHSYPIPDANHARAAIRDAARAEKVGNISRSTEQRIDAAARKKLGKKKGK